MTLKLRDHDSLEAKYNGMCGDCDNFIIVRWLIRYSIWDRGEIMTYSCISLSIHLLYLVLLDQCFLNWFCGHISGVPRK